MENAEYKQFRLDDQGQVLFQPDASNPLPGKPVARLCKGESLLAPGLTDYAEGAAPEKIQEWLAQHIATVLEPLVALGKAEGLEGATKDIAARIHEALGVMHREDLESLIAGIDEGGRQKLRALHVRLGPVLVYIPAFGKPAAIRLRAQLWNLWHGKPLPVQLPPDGVTSVTVASIGEIDPAFFLMIGYPVYGPRVIRADMLDRLVCAVYDGADKGVFKAQHAMAEWLGCPIADLYSVLEALGHTKIHDPAEEAAQQAAVTEGTEAPTAPEETESAPAAQAPQQKPELATFRLRRGRAYGENRPPRPAQKQHEGRKDRDKDKPKKDKKPQRGKHKKQGDRRDEREGRVISAAPEKNPDDSPFAILKNMKVKGGN